MTCCFVVDTGYLLALYNVPGFANRLEFIEVLKRFAARSNGDHVVVPGPVIYELARHLSQLGNRNNARQLAQKVLADLQDARTGAEDRLYDVEPMPSDDILVQLFEDFANSNVSLGHSLTDVAVIELANREKAKFNARPVYIWTWERKPDGIRAYSPDTEPVPFPL